MANWQYNISLEEILAAMGENAERKIDWNFDRTLRARRAVSTGESGLGTGETPRWYGNSEYEGSWKKGRRQGSRSIYKELPPGRGASV